MSFSRLIRLVLLAELLVTSAAIAYGAWSHGDPRHSFREDGCMTWLSAAQLLAIAFVAWRIYRVRKAQVGAVGSAGRRVWAWMCLGFAFLAVDEVAKIHEGLDGTIHDVFGLTQTSLTDHIDDLIVGLYALVGLAVIYAFWAELRRYRTALGWWAAGFVLLFAMIALDLLTNQADILLRFLAPERVQSTRDLLALVEEVLKVWAEACFLLGYLRALWIARGSAAGREVGERAVALN